MTVFIRPILLLLFILTYTVSVQAQISQSVIEQLRAERLAKMAQEKQQTDQNPSSDGSQNHRQASVSSADYEQNSPLPMMQPVVSSHAFPSMQQENIQSVTAFPQPPVQNFAPSEYSDETDEQESIGLAKYNPQTTTSRFQQNAGVEMIQKGFLQERRPDARIHDICFANHQTAWAVGDLGVIWHTQNGGLNWTLQESGTETPLYSVHFLNEQVGVAVGGKTIPYSHAGQGLLLKTTDGGQTWQEHFVYCAPILFQVKMIDSQVIVAAGNGSEFFPSGIIYSLDGGREWLSLPGGKNRGWAAVEMNNLQNGAGIGLDGRIQVIRNIVQLSRTPSPGLRRALDMSLFPFLQTPQGVLSGWLVGEGGLVMHTPDMGSIWQMPQNPIPLNHPDLFDFSAVFGFGQHVWLTGNPGTRIFYSSDAGTTWNVSSTGIQTPIRKIRFFNETHGFAVGDFGTILATQDGGRNWTIQRQGGDRLAVLGVFARIQDVPFEVLTQLCLEEGYLGGVEMIFRQDSLEHEDAEVPAMKRLHEAITFCGGSYSGQSWAFPLEHDELHGRIEKIMERLDREHDGQGVVKFREHLVARIRTLRPNLILTTDPNSESHDAVRGFLAREVLDAVSKAADPMVYPEQMTETGLQPWQVSRIQLVTDPEWSGSRAAHIKIPTQAISPRIGKTLYSFGEYARSLIETDENGPTHMVTLMNGFDLRGTNPLPLMTGIATFNTGSEAKRNLQFTMSNFYDQLVAQAQARNNSLGIIRNSENQLANVATMTANLPEEAAVSVLMTMGQQFHQTGDWESAAEIYQMIAQRYQKHPFLSKISFWLSNYCTVMKPEEQIQYDRAQYGVHKQDPTRENVQSVSYEKRDSQYLKIQEISNLFSNVGMEIFNNPRLRFTLAAAQRKYFMEDLAHQYYLSRGRTPGDDLWSTRARGEIWLAASNKSSLPPQQQECPLPLIFCRYATERPFLDGKFDDNIWSHGIPISLTPPPEAKEKKPQTVQLNERGEIVPVSHSPEKIARKQMAEQSYPFGSQMIFLYDRQFLYFAIRCPKAVDFQYEKINPDTKKTRDASILDQDRIEILFDDDRDYSVYQKLEIDYRGFARDVYWNDPSWDPTWFFARSDDEDYWYVEGAIPFSSLTKEPPQSKQAVGIALRRLVPGIGIETWNAENSFNLHEGFGYMVFE